MPRARALEPVEVADLAADAPTRLAGLLLTLPDLLALDLPALVRAAGYPSTRDIPADLLSTRSTAFGELLTAFTDPSFSLSEVARAAHITLYQLSIWSQLPAPAEAIARVRALQLTRISLAAALDGTRALTRLQSLMFDPKPEVTYPRHIRPNRSRSS